MRRATYATAIALFLSLSGAAMACEGKTVIFKDKFTDDLGGWGTSENARIGTGAMDLTAPSKDDAKNGFVSRINNVFFINSGDICVTTKMPENLSGDVGMGAIFLATDYNNYYLAEIETPGTVSIWRRVDGKWSSIFKERVASVQWGPSAENTIRVKVNGDIVSVYVNSVKVKDFRAQLPDTKWRFGAFGEFKKPSPDPAMRTFTFKNYTVTSAD